MTKTLSPPKPPRVSVPVTLDVLNVFERLAKAGNMSTGRAMAEWLGDTVEAAEFMAQTMERARAAPKIVTRELHAYALGLADETGQLMRDLADKGKRERFEVREALARGRAADAMPAPPHIPPSSNTGGKGTQNRPKSTKSGGKPV